MTILVGNKFLCVEKKVANNRIAYFLISEKISDVESSRCNHVWIIAISFQLVL